MHSLHHNPTVLFRATSKRHESSNLPLATQDPQIQCAPESFRGENVTLVSELGIEDLRHEIAHLEKELSCRPRTKATAGAGGESRRREPSVPDGRSEPRPPQAPATAVESGGRPEPRKSVKLPRFNGASPWEPFQAQLRLAAQCCGWTDGEAATHLALALEGPALQTLLDLDPAEQTSLATLTRALERRYGQRQSAQSHRLKLLDRRRQAGERWGAVAADLRFHARQGYPTFGAREQDELALHSFLRALTPEQLRHHVTLAMPHSLDEALQEAERVEEVVAEAPTASPKKPRLLVRELSLEEEEEQAKQIRTSVQQHGRPNERRCYRCDERGHIARYCPAPAPKPRKSQLPGNESGTAL